MSNKSVWVLRPKDDIPDDEWNPWNPWYHKAFGFVVYAESAEEARQIAQDNGYDEREKSPVRDDVDDYVEVPVWTDERLSACQPIQEYAESSDGPIIMKDVYSA